MRRELRYEGLYGDGLKSEEVIVVKWIAVSQISLCIKVVLMHVTVLVEYLVVVVKPSGGLLQLSFQLFLLLDL